MGNSWLTQRVFGYMDPSTSLILNVNLESGIFIEQIGEYEKKSFIPARLAFVILDLRAGNIQTKIELTHQEIVILSKKLNDAVDNKKFEPITVTRYVQKSTKRIDFIPGRPIKITIKDIETTKTIAISSESLYVLRILLNNMVNDYLGINTNMLVACQQDLLIKVLTDGKDFTNTHEKITTASVEKRDVNEWDIELPPSEHTSDIFSSEFSDDKINETKKKMIEEMKKDEKGGSVEDAPFGDKRSNSAFFNLDSLSTSILCINEGSSEDSFLPLLRIIKENVIYEEWALLFGYDYFRKNAYVLCSIKNTVKKYLKNSGKIGFIPSYRLSDKIVPGMSDIWNITVLLASHYIPLAKTVKALSKFENDMVKNDVDKLEITRFVTHNIFYPLFLSIHPRFIEKFKEDISLKIEENNKDGIYDDIKEIYNTITNGKLDLSTPTMKLSLNNITEMFEKYPIITEENIKDIPDIKTSKAVKEYVVSKMRIGSETNDVGSNTYSERSKENAMVNIETNNQQNEDIGTDVSIQLDEVFNADIMGTEFDIDMVNKLMET